jgi:predicted aspartyl protease
MQIQSGREKLHMRENFHMNWFTGHGLSRSIQHLALAAGLFLVACAPGAKSATRDFDLDALLSKGRAAQGWGGETPEFQNFRIRGDANIRDIELDYQFRFDNRGRFIRELSGVVHQSEGNDGTTVWQFHPSRGLEVLNLGDRERVLLSNWILSGYWLSPAAPVAIELESVEENRGVAVVRARFADGRYQASVEVDLSSGLPRAFFTDDLGLALGFEFSDYRASGGFQFPYRVTFLKNGNEMGGIDVSLIESNVEIEQSEFSPHAAEDRIVRFDAFKQPALEVQTGQGGKRYVRPLINGQEVGWFLFDSGAGSSMLSSEVAEKIGATRIGETESTGIGGTIKSAIVRVDSLNLGRLVVEDIILITMDMTNLSDLLGYPLVGLIGNDLMAHCVIDYDHIAASIALHDPNTFELTEGEWSVMDFYNGKPAVVVSYENNSGIYTIDTGASGAMTIGPDTVERQGLLEGRKTWPSTNSGIGGRIKTRRGRLEWVEFGGKRFEDVPVSFLIEKKGAVSDRMKDGLVGVYFLQQFRVVFDYPNRRIAYLEN